jgi:hypothetical protein
LDAGGVTLSDEVELKVKAQVNLKKKIRFFSGFPQTGN